MTRTLSTLALAAMTWLTLGLLALSAAPRFAQAHDTVRLSFGIASQFAWTDSVDALQSADRFLASDLRFGVGVWQGLSVEAGYRHLSGGGDTFAEALQTDILFHTIDLGVRYDWPLLSWLSVYGRAGASAAYVSTEVEWYTARVTADGWTPGAFASGGVGVRFPRAWFGGEDNEDGGTGFTVGLGLDVGYAWFLDLEQSGRPTPSGGDGQSAGIQQAAVQLGTLRVHGATVQLGLSLHY